MIFDVYISDAETPENALVNDACSTLMFAELDYDEAHKLANIAVKSGFLAILIPLVAEEE